MTNKAMPGITMLNRHPRDSPAPKLKITARINGMTIWVTPPPKLPQPAAVALAVPTQLGANITDV